MLCEHACEHLSAYLDKELTADLSAAVRDHLSGCAACRTLLEELRATADLLGRLPVHAAPAGLADDVQREIEVQAIVEAHPPADEQPLERTLLVHRARVWPRVLAAAATLVLVGGIGLLAYLAGPTAPGNAPVAKNAAEGLGEVASNRREFREAPAAGEYYLGDVAKDNRDAKSDATPAKIATGLRALGRDVADKAAAAKAAQPDTNLYLNDGTTVSGPVAVQEKVAAGDGYLINAPQPTDNATVAGVVMDGGTVDALATTRGATAAGWAKRKHAESSTGAPAGKAGAVVVEGLGAKPMTGGTTVGVVVPPAGAVMALVNGVIAGTNTLSDFRRVATRENLGRIDSQLVVETASRTAANRELEDLFAANGWVVLAQALVVDQDGDSSLMPRPEKRADDPTTIKEAAKTYAYGEDRAAGGRPPVGVYYRVHQNGEDTYIVVADRDSLSRFGGQLAQNGRMTVVNESSPEFRAIGRLQTQLRSGTALAMGEKPPEEGRGRRAGGKGEETKDAGGTLNLKTRGQFESRSEAEAVKQEKGQTLDESRGMQVAGGAAKMSQKGAEEDRLLREKVILKEAAQPDGDREQPMARQVETPPTEVAHAAPAKPAAHRGDGLLEPEQKPSVNFEVNGAATVAPAAKPAETPARAPAPAAKPAETQARAPAPVELATAAGDPAAVAPSAPAATVAPAKAPAASYAPKSLPPAPAAPPAAEPTVSRDLQQEMVTTEQPAVPGAKPESATRFAVPAVTPPAPAEPAAGPAAVGRTSVAAGAPTPRPDQARPAKTGKVAGSPKAADLSKAKGAEEVAVARGGAAAQSPATAAQSPATAGQGLGGWGHGQGAGAGQGQSAGAGTGQGHGDIAGQRGNAQTFFDGQTFGLARVFSLPPNAMILVIRVQPIRAAAEAAEQSSPPAESPARPAAK